MGCEHAKALGVEDADCYDCILKKWKHKRKHKMKCIVKGCTNRSTEGTFVGDICSPCYEMITTGEIRPSNNFISAIKADLARTRKERDAYYDELMEKRVASKVISEKALVENPI